MPEKTQTLSFSIELNELNRRVRMMEIKIEKMEEMFLSIEKTVKQLETDLKILKDIMDKKIIDIKNDISSVNEKVETLNKKTDQFVSKVELQKIKMFLDIVNPLTTSYVSKEELEARIEELKKSILKQESKI
jgi:predicted  nucleic acid-binding Zn-ribbon protein